MFCIKKNDLLELQEGLRGSSFVLLISHLSIHHNLACECLLSFSSVDFKPIQGRILVLSLHIPSSMLDVC